MRQLRNINSGVVVSVSDSTAALLDGEWVPTDAAEPKRKPGRPKKSEGK